MEKQNLDFIFNPVVVDYPDELTQNDVALVEDFTKLQPGDKVCIWWGRKNPTFAGFYVGKVTRLHKNQNLFEVTVEKYFRFSTNSPAIVPCERNVGLQKNFGYIPSQLKVFLIQRNDLRAQAEARKAYAQQRKAFSMARQTEKDSFVLLGLTLNSSMEDFSKVKRAMMLKWHPDRQMMSELSPEEFEKKSKEITDALAYVFNILSKK